MKLVIFQQIFAGMATAVAQIYPPNHQSSNGKNQQYQEVRLSVPELYQELGTGVPYEEVEAQEGDGSGQQPKDKRSYSYGG